MTDQNRAQFRANELYLARMADWWDPREEAEPEPEYTNLSSNFDKLEEGKKQLLLKWIQSTFVSAKTIFSAKGPLGPYSSYGLKHVFERTIEKGDYYVSNGQFKGAMVECGFLPVVPGELNWRFRIKVSQEFKTRMKAKARA